MSDKPQFDVDAEGQVILFSLLGYSIRPVAGIFAALQLRYATKDEEIATPSRLQLSLSAIQCRAIAADLLTAAQMMEQSRPPGRPM